MLHIERKQGQVVCIGTEIRIIVTKTSSGLVKLSFEAPTDIKIYREELLHRSKGSQTETVHHLSKSN
ncbi:hypothetical protein VNPA120661_57740 [Pseudomonas aeruginosa]|uniref:Carbon storage regulator n=1 Tax=Pseudomonas aeruginosa TaxID=287 RepID=A0A6C0L2F7_PSEAI|nr:carbon storage regulator [Pseudomonas aeruginosa]MDS9749578.1 carbon storage regulator [Pseudomonas aeruginosa]QHU24365.1 Carbon storage regulator [Pseudomonas aeruginosa]QZH54210.1 carbon storage regulator [Pseudomonas aeruginosa]RUJ11751.1 carbon storage regulator [Pseudomonas aeruginosa]RUJ33812.1 carbon storage regulator [Pseudomonas aeruginosa]